MKLGLKFLSTLYSLIIVAFIVGLSLVFFYPSKNAPTDNFGIAILLILFLIFAIVIGLTSIILRLLGVLKSGASFFINFTGTLNLFLGILGIVLLCTNNLTDKFSIALFCLSFLLGICILADFFISKIQST